MNPSTIEVSDAGITLAFSYQDMLRYHGPGYPGGVAHAYKVLERVLPALSTVGPPERREIVIETSFRGPGARDGFELVTRAVTGDRYTINPELERTERGTTLARYVFVISYRGTSVTAVIREGYVTDEFISLARQEVRSVDEEGRLVILKQEMADRLLADPATHVYDIEET